MARHLIVQLTFLVGLVFDCIVIHGNAEVSQMAKDLALEWAPLIWLHSEETFYPSDVDFYLENMEVRQVNENVVQENLTSLNLVVGGATSDYHLNTIDPINCVHCYLDHFSGQPLNDITVHAQVLEYNDSCRTIDISFPTFYPYNYGKDVCIGLEPNSSCEGLPKTFGNHISDWEHTEIRFQNGMPTNLYLAVHSFGAFYAYNHSTRTFDFYFGEPLHKRPQPLVEVDYPQTVYLVEGNHPEVFSANGSHGTWGSPGKHTYFNFFIHLDDFTERGEPWRTWERMDFVDRYNDDLLNGTTFQWLNFQGRWGNIEELGCELDPLVGECGLSKGVRGPGPSTSFELPPICP